MPRPPHARDKVLDAFEDLLIRETERGATLEAVAHAAGVSKGGLLYHFPSKHALEQAQLQRMQDLADDDILEMEASPAGLIDAFIRSSAGDGSPLDRALLAAGKLASAGSADATAALNHLRQLWRDLLRPAVTNETSLALVMLVADGVYFNAALTNDPQETGMFGTLPELTDLDALIALVQSAVQQPTTR